MKSLPIQQRALQKRQALIDAAIREFSKLGFEVATAKSIAADAGVATGTFYQYFENKNDILRVIAQSRFSHLTAQMPVLSFSAVDSVVEREDKQRFLIEFFATTLDFVYDFHASDPALHQVLEQRRTVDKALRDIMEAGEAALRKRVLQFVKSTNVKHPEVVADNLFSMGEGIVHRHVFDASQQDPKLVISIGASMLASYFLTQK